MYFNTISIMHLLCCPFTNSGFVQPSEYYALLFEKFCSLKWILDFRMLSGMLSNAYSHSTNDIHIQQITIHTFNGNNFRSYSEILIHICSNFLFIFRNINSYSAILLFIFRNVNSYSASFIHIQQLLQFIFRRNYPLKAFARKTI